MPFKDPSAKNEANKASAIRTRIRNKKAVSQRDRAWLDDYESRHKRSKRRAQPAAPAQPNAQGAPAAQGAQGPVAPTTPIEGKRVEVHSSLPGEEGTRPKEGPPPIDLGSSSQTTTSDGPAGGNSNAGDAAHDAAASTAQGARTNGKGPALSPDEAEAGAEMLAAMATKILMEFNSYNLAHGAGGITEDFAKYFKFSLKRLAMKYGSVIDEDTHDYLIVGGSASWVGWNSFLVYKAKKAGAFKDEQTAQPGAAAQQPTAPKKEEPAHGNADSAPTGGIRQQPNGSGFARPQLPRKSRVDFDPRGVY